MLLETARELIARDGEGALTLSAVADEAGLAHATVYGYFTGKRDLLAALGPVQAFRASDASPAEQVDEHAVHDPLDHQSSLAALIQEPVGPDSVEESDSAPLDQVDDRPPVALPATSAEAAEETSVVGEASTPEERLESQTSTMAPETVVTGIDEESSARAPVATTHYLEDGAAVSDFASEVATPSVSTPVPDHSEQADAREDLPADAPAKSQGGTERFFPPESERRQHVAHLEAIARRLILPESALKQGADAVISRLEIRMKVLERAVAGVEARQNTITDESERKIKPVSGLVNQMQARADIAEDRLRQALAELRMHIHELKARQDRLEGGTKVAVAEIPAWPEPAMEIPTDKDESANGENVREASQEEAPEANPKLGYLSAVRNSAKEGARQAAERQSLEEEEESMRRRRLLTAAGVAVVCLALAGLLFRFHPGTHGVSTAQSMAIAPSAMPQQLHAAVPRTPLDRLTDLANKGNARAELVIGLKYLKGDGIVANDTQAARWLERAARAGDPIAENHLGALYQTGRGVKSDIAQAMHWYEAAAAQGNRHAMSNLAVLHAGGAGAPANFADAARWFQRAASLGYVDAQFNLAVLFERGDGVPQSLLDAYKWYSIAAAAGDAVAKTRAAAIATQVSPEELQAAQQAVTNFKPLSVNQIANDTPTMAQVLAVR